MGRSVLVVLPVAQILHYAAAVFFQEPTSAILQPSEFSNTSDFGFSMGYRPAFYHLMVGAPSVNNFGKVYSCDVLNPTTTTKCLEHVIDIGNLTKYSRKNYPDQYFYNGASIAATSEYLFTCAPMLTYDIQTKSKITISDAVGTCFTKNRKDTRMYVGTYEKLIKGKKPFTDYRPFIGGTGWTTLVDKNLLIIAKTSLLWDFLYTRADTPLGTTNSVLLSLLQGQSKSKKDTIIRKMYKFQNVGHAMTSGKFFSSTETVYAFSSLIDDKGAILFLNYIKPKLEIVSDRENKWFMLNSTEIGAMFGAAMNSGDLNRDGMDELLVGAATQSEEDCLDCGALHIYLGGDMQTLNNRNRLRTILGNKDFGRFGTAIACQDIDGDNMPDIAVSAPYEDDGVGAVYVISGRDIHALVKLPGYVCRQISDLKLTQRLQKRNYRTLGFSLQIIPDVDDNGCKELAVGSPGSGTVFLFKSITPINVTVSLERIGDKYVKEQDKQFHVKVCTIIKLMPLAKLPSNKLDGKLLVTSSIVGNSTSIKYPNFTIPIYDCLSANLKCCENVTVDLNDHEQGKYNFSSKAVLDTSSTYNGTDINNIWEMSPYSTLENSYQVSRFCKLEDCNPELHLDAFWSGGSNYELGSTDNETVTVKVNNTGHESHDTCVLVSVKGARVPTGLAPANCVTYFISNRFLCYITPNPLKRYSETSIKLMLDMTMPKNDEKNLLVQVWLHENCNQRNLVTNMTKIEIPFNFIPDSIYINSTSHNRNVTDTEILDREFIVDDQDFVITNTGPITWQKINASITMTNQSFINSFQVTAIGLEKCVKNYESQKLSYNCTFNLAPNSTQKINAVTELISKEIENNLSDGKLNMTSMLELNLLPFEVKKFARATNIRTFQKDLSIGNNKLLIGLLAALLAIIMLAILIFILYKFAFFRRKHNERLLVHKESVRRQSVRRATHVSEEGAVEGLPSASCDDVDDCAFDDVQTTR